MLHHHNSYYIIAQKGQKDAFVGDQLCMNIYVTHPFSRQ